jgi:O-antigen ligase
MKALIELVPLLLVLFAIAKSNFKHFLLIAAIVTIPFRCDLGFGSGHHVGWISGVDVSISDLFMVLLAAMALTGETNGPKSLDKIPKAFCVFIACCLLSVVNSVAKPESGEQILLLLQVLFLCYLGFKAAINDPADMQAVLTGVSLSLALQGAIACAQFGLQKDFLLFSTGGNQGETDVVEGEASAVIRAFGTLGKPNSLAMLVAPMLLLNVALLQLKDLPGRKLRLLSLFLGFLALIFSGSRAGWLSFFCAFSVYIAIIIFRLERGRRFQAIGRVLAVVALGLIVCSPFIVKRLTADDKNAAGSRLPLMEVALRIFEDHPIIGIGANTYQDNMKQYLPADFGNKYLYVVHNAYLLILAELGVVGFTAFLLLGRRLFQAAILASRALDNPLQAALGLGLILIMTQVCTNMMAEWYVNKTSLSLLFALAATVIAAAKFQPDAPEPVSEIGEEIEVTA